ncbi:1,3-beta-glucanosyltransferase-4 [Coleophoma cylindrospora]|uniref:1,3-beta-glucanosyltransferase n=1 Tax=Coleophoma cylindrospora TaxID=1849047 RepID=A0A3D8QXJ0_9HELO|nr:1,3-beta-glucanosyltransferase-4 [Coleophoma cylindrospora]
MKTAAVFAALAATVGALATRTESLSPRQATTGDLPIVTVRGNAFFAGQERFYIRGVAYQPGGAADAADPLVDIPSLTRDVANFKKLGINTIRVYTVDNSANHDEGMKLLADAGIYLALDANTPAFSLNRADNASLYLSYNEKYLQSLFATIDSFQGYSNLLLMINGNEVINERNNTIAAPYIKAVARDMKNYIANRGYRAIPVGYAAADVAENIVPQLEYFDCGPDAVRGDFFALNDYSWCDPSSFTISGWDQKVKRYSNYGAPIFMAEFGCITNTRQWGEIAALYSSNMTSVYSGGLAYEYSVEANGYGLVNNVNGVSTPNADFERLLAAYEATPNPSGDGGYNQNTSASACPAASDDWQVKTLLLPSMPSGAETFMKNGAGPGPGLGDVTPSQYGGETYSESQIEMDGALPTGTVSSGGSGSTSGSSSSSSASASGSAAAGRLAPDVVFLMPITIALLGVLAGMGLIF